MLQVFLMDFAVPRRSLEVHGRPFPTAPYWWRWHMEGALIVIPLVALVLPIAMLLAAIAFDAAIVAWAIYRTVHDHPPHPGHWLHRPH